jgi:uncharacterized protein
MDNRRAAERSPGRFDAFHLAHERGTLTGVVDAANLSRVEDRLVENPAPIEWRIAGATDAMGRPALKLAIDGEVVLECQRCLGPLKWPLAERTELLLARSDAETVRLDAESDAEVLLAAAPLDPLALIEDELLLALPFAARHPEGECTPPATGA